MNDIVKWGDIGFYVSQSGFRGLQKLGITASTDTEDETNSGQSYVKVKNSKWYQIELTALLDARMGEDVQRTAMLLTEAAREHKSGYFYTRSAKLLPTSFMMVSAKVEDILFDTGGIWLSCKVTMTLKQDAKMNSTNNNTNNNNNRNNNNNNGDRKPGYIITKHSSLFKNSTGSATQGNLKANTILTSVGNSRDGRTYVYAEGKGRGWVNSGNIMYVDDLNRMTDVPPDNTTNRREDDVPNLVNNDPVNRDITPPEERMTTWDRSSGILKLKG